MLITTGAIVIMLKNDVDDNDADTKSNNDENNSRFR